MKSDSATTATVRSSSPSGPRVLFFAEAVTLAHIARPATLAGSLAAAGHEVHLAADGRYDPLFPNLAATRHPLTSIPTLQFVTALARGKPIYDRAMLARYVEDDLRVIDEVRPDVIVGDFRLSLSVSSAQAKVPYIAIANAYWSPFAQVHFPVPDHAVSRWFGRTIGQWLFSMARPVVFARYAAPLNDLRMHHGLPTIPGGLPGAYTHGDFTAYADVPSLVPMPLPANHVFLGPVLWSPPVALPAWWNDVPTDRPIVYVNLGSSGDARQLPRLLAALARLDVTVIAATAGANTDSFDAAFAGTTATGRRRIYIADFLPGDAACARADLVICNGGSPATQQALAQGKPVIGVPSNLDQWLNIQALTGAGVAAIVHPGWGFARRMSAAVTKALGNSQLRTRAAKAQAELRQFDSGQRLTALIESIASSPAAKPIAA